MTTLISIIGLGVAAFALAFWAGVKKRRERRARMAASEREAERLYEVAASRLRAKSIKAYWYD